MKLHCILLLTLALLPCNLFGMNEPKKPTKEDLQRDIVFYQHMINSNAFELNFKQHAFIHLVPQKQYRDTNITVSLTKDRNFEIRLNKPEDVTDPNAKYLKEFYFTKFVAEDLLRDLSYSISPHDSTIEKLKKECLTQEKFKIIRPVSGTKAIGFNFCTNIITPLLDQEEQNNFLKSGYGDSTHEINFQQQLNKYKDQLQKEKRNLRIGFLIASSPLLLWLLANIYQSYKQS